MEVKSAQFYDCIFDRLRWNFLFYGTNKLTPRGAEIAKAVNQRGDKIYFITSRKENNKPESLSLTNTHREAARFEL